MAMHSLLGSSKGGSDSCPIDAARVSLKSHLPGSQMEWHYSLALFTDFSALLKSLRERKFPGTTFPPLVIHWIGFA